jgi:hypothetical protein
MKRALKVSGADLVAKIKTRPPTLLACGLGWKALQKLGGGRRPVYNYKDAILFFLDQVQESPRTYPCLVPNWDNSPRSGFRGLILHRSTPELFRQHVRETIKLVENREPEDRIVFVKSWNEWAEGNYLEPDLRFGRAYLDVLREEITTRSGFWHAFGRDNEFDDGPRRGRVMSKR